MLTSGSGSKPAMPPINRAGRLSPLGLILLAVTSVGWGLNFPIMKHLLTEWPPLSSRGLCGIVGAAALALVALARRQKLSVPRPMWLRLLLVSMLTIGGWVAFMGLALLWLNASEAAVLGISIPVWVAFLAWPILGERLSPLRAVALTVALAGIAVLIGGNGIEASVEKLPGVACALVGAVCVGLGTVLTKHFPLAMPPLSLAAWQIGLGCLPIAIVGLAVEQPHLAALSYVGWASLLYMTLIQFCLCYVCWFAALERLPAATASIGTLLVPVIGVLAAAAMLREPLGLRETRRAGVHARRRGAWRCAPDPQTKRAAHRNAPPFELTTIVLLRRAGMPLAVIAEIGARRRIVGFVPLHAVRDGIIAGRRRRGDGAVVVISVASRRRSSRGCRNSRMSTRCRRRSRRPARSRRHGVTMAITAAVPAAAWRPTHRPPPPVRRCRGHRTAATARGRIAGWNASRP